MEPWGLPPGHRTGTPPPPWPGGVLLLTAGGRPLPRQQPSRPETALGTAPGAGGGPPLRTQAPLPRLPCPTSLDVDTDIGPRRSASHPLGPGFARPCVVSSPAPRPQPPISTFRGLFWPEQPPSHSPCSCDCLWPPSARRKETGPGKGASGRAAPGYCWRGRAGGGQRCVRPEGRGAPPALFTQHLWVRRLGEQRGRGS